VPLSFPLTGAVPEQAMPPQNPYGPTSALLSSVSGNATYWVRGAHEICVGRDPAVCTIVLDEPRVSGVHATLKVEERALWVRDEGSNNGTWLAGRRLEPRRWFRVVEGSVRFGPVEFSVRVE
jgi:pSer/pThr/pTyr-binding forkhead associated (FHA) protein